MVLALILAVTANTLSVLGKQPQHSVVIYGNPQKEVPGTPFIKQNPTLGKKNIYGKVIASTDKIDIYTCKLKGIKGHHMVLLESQDTISLYCGTKYKVGDRILVDSLDEGV